MHESAIYLVEQAARLKEQAVGAMLATLVVVAYVVYFVHGQVDSQSLYLWVATVLAINLYLLVWVILIHRNEITGSNVNRFVGSYQVEAVLHGLSWGYLPFLLSQAQDINIQLFSYYVICGMAAGAIATTGMIYRIYISYMLPMMLPIVVHQLFIDQAPVFASSTVGLLVIFIIAMLMLSFRHYESVIKSIMFSRRNDELVHDLKEQYQRAEEASHAKSRFLANMSHELRTPLNAVIGYSEIIEEEADESGAERISADAEKIRLSGKHLLNMIDDVLSLSRLDAGKVVITRKRFHINELLKKITPSLKDYADLNNNNLEIVIDPAVEMLDSDIHLLEKILINLVGNAGKFTRDGDITLHIHEQGRSGKQNVCFVIEDTGIGMDEQQMAIAFDAFRQADESSTRKYGGMGLGMAISKKFTELLDGSIEVESQPGKGTRVTVCLPSSERMDARHAS